MLLNNNTRMQTPIRYRKARSDGSLGPLQKEIEFKYGLPPGSVRLVRPDGRKMRSDAMVETFRKLWD